MIDLSGLVDNARLFLIVLARVAGLMRTAPVVSSSAIHSIGRGALIFFTAIIMVPIVRNSYGTLPPDGLSYLMILLAEVMLGILMGLFLQIVFAVFQTAGQLFSFQMGLSASTVYDPLAQIESPLMGQFLNLIGLAVFLATDGMKKLFFSGLIGSFRVMKGTDFLSSDTFLRETLIRAIGGLFQQSVILAFPIMGTLIIISVTLGLLAKAAPQMNLLMVGFPIQIGTAFLIILLVTPFFTEKMSIVVDSGFKMIESYLIASREALP